jgi:hypothetical protein
MKTHKIKTFIGLSVLAIAAVVFGSACGKAKAQDDTQITSKTIKPAETATPYKPLKRVSRDIIKPEPKDEAVAIKTKQ